MHVGDLPCAESAQTRGRRGPEPADLQKNPGPHHRGRVSPVPCQFRALGRQRAPCPAPSSTVGAPGLDHLPALIPRQQMCSHHCPGEGQTGSSQRDPRGPAASSSLFPRHSSAHAGGGGVTRPLRSGGPGAKPGPGCREARARSPSLPPSPPASGPQQRSGEEAPPPSAATTRPEGPGGCAHLGRRPARRVAAVAPPRRPASDRAGSGGPTRAHWPASS